MINIINNFLKNTPFYPHYLEFKNLKKDSEYSYSFLHGRVLETGAGDLYHKNNAIRLNNKIIDYIATDYNSWDDLFSEAEEKANKFAFISKLIYGTQHKIQENLDEICDATNLPFKNEEFDSYCSYEVLEHIKDVDAYFKEAYRVLKKGGVMVISMPFLYREHGGVEFDFQRYTKGGFYNMAKKHSFDIKNIYTNACFGTTISSMINQYIIRNIVENKNYLIKITLLSISPFIFFINNIIGFLLDKISKDDRFAMRYFVILQKK